MTDSLAMRISLRRTCTCPRACSNTFLWRWWAVTPGLMRVTRSLRVRHQAPYPLQVGPIDGHHLVVLASRPLGAVATQMALAMARAHEFAASRVLEAARR